MIRMSSALADCIKHQHGQEPDEQKMKSNRWRSPFVKGSAAIALFYSTVVPLYYNTAPMYHVLLTVHWDMGQKSGLPVLQCTVLATSMFCAFVRGHFCVRCHCHSTQSTRIFHRGQPTYLIMGVGVKYSICSKELFVTVGNLYARAT